MSGLVRKEDIRNQPFAKAALDFFRRFDPEALSVAIEKLPIPHQVFYASVAKRLLKEFAEVLEKRVSARVYEMAREEGEKSSASSFKLVVPVEGGGFEVVATERSGRQSFDLDAVKVWAEHNGLLDRVLTPMVDVSKVKALRELGMIPDDVWEQFVKHGSPSKVLKIKEYGDDVD